MINLSAMNRFLLKFGVSLIAFMSIGASKYANGEEWTRDDVAISVSGGAIVNAELYIPVRTSPRALVIAVPGTGGLSDPYFDSMIGAKEYNPDSRGGFTAALLHAGYAVVFYNQRGYAPLRKCVVGENAFLRAVSFVERCIDKIVRAQVSLSVITNDTRQVFDYFSREQKTKMLNQVAIAWSEGTFHVAKLIHLSQVAPIATVFIGGPVQSIATTMRYQSTREYFFQLIDTAFANCNKSVVTVLDVFRCTGTRPTTTKYASLREIAKSGLLARDALVEKRKYFSKFYNVLVEQYDHLPSAAVVSGELLGVQLDVGWSTMYFREMFSANLPVLDILKNYSGKILFLYGSEDELVNIPEPGACKTNSVAMKNCIVKIVQYAGHGLEDGRGTIAQNVFDIIANSIDLAIKESD